MKDRDRAVFRTPLGWAGVVVTGRGVVRVVLPRKERTAVERELGPSVEASREGSALMKRAVRTLERYFAGEAVAIDLPLDLGKETAFQRAVRKAAVTIPRGATRSYAWIAGRAGSPRAARAVGQVMAANPVPVLVPCHRVVSSAGSLGGFSGGPGLKQRMLDLEKNKAGKGKG